MVRIKFETQMSLSWFRATLNRHVAIAEQKGDDETADILFGVRKMLLGREDDPSWDWTEEIHSDSVPAVGKALQWDLPRRVARDPSEQERRWNIVHQLEREES